MTGLRPVIPCRSRPGIPKFVTKKLFSSAQNKNHQKHTRNTYCESAFEPGASRLPCYCASICVRSWCVCRAISVDSKTKQKNRKMGLGHSGRNPQAHQRIPKSVLLHGSRAHHYWLAPWACRYGDQGLVHGTRPPAGPLSLLLSANCNLENPRLNPGRGITLLETPNFWPWAGMADKKKFITLACQSHGNWNDK